MVTNYVVGEIPERGAERCFSGSGFLVSHLEMWGRCVKCGMGSALPRLIVVFSGGLLRFSLVHFLYEVHSGLLPSYFLWQSSVYCWFETTCCHFKGGGELWMSAVRCCQSVCCLIFSGYNIEGSQPEWCISSMIYSRDTPFWSGTLDMCRHSLQHHVSTSTAAPCVNIHCSTMCQHPLQHHVAMTDVLLQHHVAVTDVLLQHHVAVTDVLLQHHVAVTDVLLQLTAGCVSGPGKEGLGDVTETWRCGRDVVSTAMLCRCLSLLSHVLCQYGLGSCCITVLLHCSVPPQPCTVSVWLGVLLYNCAPPLFRPSSAMYCVSMAWGPAV